MDVFEAIYARHSQGKVSAEELPREVIEKLLGAAAQAPNHYKLRPWRFVVLTGKGREALGEAMAASLRARFPDLPAEGLEKERQKPLRAPLVIAVAADLVEGSKGDEIENIAAAAAACQNILLAAHALGLASIWRTGDNARDTLVKQFLGFKPAQHLIGFLYIGYPAGDAPVWPERPGFDDRVVWMG